MRHRAVIAGLSMATVLLLVGCGSNATSSGSGEQNGTLRGNVIIGPLCPVEPCQGSQVSHYAGRELLLAGTDGSPVRVPLNNDGSFSVSLEPGTYDVQLEDCNYLGCNRVFPVETTIPAGRTVTLNIDVDTGIR